MNRKLVLAFATAGLFLASTTFPGFAAEKAEKTKTITGDGLCAKLTKVTDGQTTDDKNPDPSKRSQPIIGLVIMENAKKSGANKWSGTLYNRENGKSYSGSITVKSKDAVDLSGCVALVLCRAVTWTRIK